MHDFRLNSQSAATERFTRQTIGSRPRLRRGWRRAHVQSALLHVLPPTEFGGATRPTGTSNCSGQICTMGWAAAPRCAATIRACARASCSGARFLRLHLDRRDQLLRTGETDVAARAATARHGIEARIHRCRTQPTASIPQRVDALRRQVMGRGGLEATDLHFVGHSTGGLHVARADPPRRGRALHAGGRAHGGDRFRRAWHSTQPLRSPTPTAR